MEVEQELAIKVRGIVKGYGSSLVLKGLDMDVPYGSM
jgi:ABC-type transporter Mla maintaining outer membrane lipid asymmetry ATPase subunit MlaF